MKILVLQAVEEERFPLALGDHDLVRVITGMGKVNASMAATHGIFEQSPDLVLNIGTCAAIHHKVGDIFVCRDFVDRDLAKISGLGLVSEYAFHDELAERGYCRDWTGGGVCNTGDSFLTEHTDAKGDCFDMEAFAVAHVCKARRTPFLSVKYVTDIIGQNSVEHWKEKLAHARADLERFFAARPAIA